MKKIIFTVITTISFLFFGCASLNTTNKPEDYYSENYRRYRTENRTVSDLCKISETFYSYLLSSEIQFDTDIYDHTCPINKPVHQTTTMSFYQVEVWEGIFRNPLRTISQDSCA